MSDKSLNLEQRVRASTLEEEIAANPYDAAHEMIFLRDEVERLREPLNSVNHIPDWMKISLDQRIRRQYSFLFYRYITIAFWVGVVAGVVVYHLIG